MNYRTYSNTPAGVQLAEMLDERPNWIKHDVSNRIHKFGRGLNILSNSIKDEAFLKKILFLFREKEFEMAGKMKLPNEIKSRMLNVMSMYFAKKIKNLE
jgi:hypothetical protein